MSCVERTKECVVMIQLNEGAAAVCAYRSGDSARVFLPKDTKQVIRGMFRGRRSCTVAARARLIPSEGKHPWVLGKGDLLGPVEKLDEEQVSQGTMRAMVKVSLRADGRVVYAKKVTDEHNVIVGRSALGPLARLVRSLPAVVRVMATLVVRDGDRLYLYASGVGRLIGQVTSEWEEVEVAVEIPSPSRSDGRTLTGRITDAEPRLRFDGTAVHRVIDLLGCRPGAGKVVVKKPRGTYVVRDPAWVVGLARG